MSERELRNGAAHKDWCRHKDYWGECDCGLNKVLALDPDVVAVLRLVLRMRDGMEPSGHNLPFRAAMEMLYEHIVAEFHVRLTDDGWEWTEEATDE